MADAEPKQESKTLTEEDLKTKNTIYVKNSDFPSDFDEEKLKELFKECGSVVSATLLRKPGTKELRGTGFVEFDSHDAAAKAVKEYNNKLVGNGRLGVVFSTSSGPKEPKPVKEVEEGPTLFIRSLNYKVKQNKLRKEFDSFGKITSCRVNRKGYAFIEFDSVDAAKKAKEEMNGKEVEGKAVEIFFAEKREPRQKREKKGKAEKKEDKKEQTTPEKKSKRKRRRKGKGNKNKEEASDDKKPEKPEEKKEEKKPKGRRRVFLKCMVEEGKEKMTDGVNEEVVRGYLEKFGEVQKCKVVQKDAGTFVYVGIKSPEDAAKIVEAGKGEIGGSEFTFLWARNSRRPGRGKKNNAGATAI